MLEVNQAYQSMKGGRLVYWDTPNWSNGQRAAVTVKLLEAKVPHRWEGDGSLSVHHKYEGKVDRILALRSSS